MRDDGPGGFDRPPGVHEQERQDGPAANLHVGVGELGGEERDDRVRPDGLHLLDGSGTPFRALDESQPAGEPVLHMLLLCGLLSPLARQARRPPL